MLYFKNSGLWVLLLANVLILIRYFVFGLPVEAVILGYWMQSVVLGIFHVYRLWVYPALNGSWLKRSRFSAIAFFLFHYMGFHLGYLFLLVVTIKSPAMFSGWDVSLVAFLFAGFFELRNNLHRDKTNHRNYADTLFVLPYIRVIPMQLFVVGPNLLGISHIGAFLLLKVLADVIFYFATPSVKRKGAVI